MSTPHPAASAADIVTEAEVSGLVAAKVKELGGPGKAAPKWGCSLQMVHLVSKGQRRPTDAMLEELGLVEVQTQRHYERKDRA